MKIGIDMLIMIATLHGWYRDGILLLLLLNIYCYFLPTKDDQQWTHRKRIVLLPTKIPQLGWPILAGAATFWVTNHSRHFWIDQKSIKFDFLCQIRKSAEKCEWPKALTQKPRSRAQKRATRNHPIRRKDCLRRAPQCSPVKEQSNSCPKNVRLLVTNTLK